MMLRKLTRKHNEVKRLLSIYEDHKDNPDAALRRRAHLEVDRWLMENRETALLCVERVLTAELKTPHKPWYAKILRRRTKGGSLTDGATFTRDV